jgi:hypothetical protein
MKITLFYYQKKYHDVLLIPEYTINGNSEQTIIEVNHFLIQTIRIPLNEKPSVRKIIQLVLNIDQYIGSGGKHFSYNFQIVAMQKTANENDLLSMMSSMQCYIMELKKKNNEMMQTQKENVKKFAEKFTLIAGREYFEGKIKDMMREYNAILLSYTPDESLNINNIMTINKKANGINENADIIKKWWIKLMVKYYDKLLFTAYDDEKKYMESSNYICNRYKKYCEQLTIYEYDEIIDTYDKYLKYVKNNIDDIIIINKINKVGFIKFSDKNYK